MSTPRLRDRLRYRFDNTMSRGTPALIGLLGVASLVLILVVGLVAEVFADDQLRDQGIAEMLWRSMLRTLDPGTMGGDEGSAGFLLLMLLVTIGGIFIVAALVGVLNTGLEARLNQLRKGRSRVVESGHTVLLGWSDQVFTMISELVTANESGRRSCVAVLAARDKLEMEEEIRARVGSTGRTRIVCRTGHPTEPTDLDLMNLETAKAIIVLSPEADDRDALVIKTLLALSNRTWDGGRPPIVAAVSEGRNLAAARLAGGAEALVIDADDIAARLIVQTSRQAGLSVVCTDLLDFDGDEIYMHADPRLAGMAYGDVLYAYETATVIGLRHADGGVVLNPRATTPVQRSDQVIVIAEDDSTIRLATSWPKIARDSITAVPPTAVPPERMLMLGWNTRGPKVVEQLDQYVAPGSELQVAARHLGPEAGLESLQPRLQRMLVSGKETDVTDRAALEALGVGTYRHVIVLADDDVEADHADSRTLVTLLHLRDMESTLGERYSIVSEMNDERNRKLAQVTKADDFVVSGKLLSLLLTQLAENRHLAAVFTQLFDPRGSEIYLKPAESYVRLGAWINFATVIEAARRRGETAIGYRVHTRSFDPPNYGVRLNPDKHNPLVLEPGDKVIVLAES